MPVLVGISQLEQRVDDPANAREPIELMTAAVRAAAADAGSSELLNATAVRVIGGKWSYQNPARAVAEAVGNPTAETGLSPFSGNFVQTTLNKSCLDIQSGKHDVVVITGAECGSTQARAARANVELQWQELPGTPDVWMGDELDLRHPAEWHVGLGFPMQFYPMFELALRHHLGLGVAEHLVFISELWAGFSKVAAGNPHAWIREAKSAEDIRALSAFNRPVSYPYYKFMNSNSNVDQGAALILCSEEKAKALGIARAKWVYPWAGTDAQDHYFVSNRDNFYSSPAIRFAGRRCMELAAVDVSDLAMVDVYSCFPVAVQVAARELELDTTRPLTVTGGMTWAGGPVSNYVMHSIARMAELLRGQPGGKGLITANGGFLTKHAFGVYSTEAPPQAFQHENLQAQVDATFKRDLVVNHRGRASVEAYSVMYGAGVPEKAFIACRLEDDRRAWAVNEEPDVLAAMVEEEFCGRHVNIADHVATF